MAIPLPRQGDRGKHVRMLLLSPLDMDANGNGMARIERLFHLDSGHLMAVIFLLENKGRKEDGVKGYMELQAR